VGKLQQQRRRQALGMKGDFAVDTSEYGNVQAGLTPTSDVRREKKKKEASLLA
jgi:hypothetical protein